MNIFAGMILAELSALLPSCRPSRLFSTVSYLLATIGLYLCSYPRRNAHYTLWSRTLMQLGSGIFPTFANDYRYWQGLGAQILCAAILLSPSMQRALSSKYLTSLGRLSFPIYMLHGTLMRTVLAWGLSAHGTWSSTLQTVSSIRPAFDPSICLLGSLMIVVLISSFLGFLLVIANIWSNKIEPYFDKLTTVLYGFAQSWGRRNASSAPYSTPLSPSTQTSDGKWCYGTLSGDSSALQASSSSTGTLRGRYSVERQWICDRLIDTMSACRSEVGGGSAKHKDVEYGATPTVYAFSNHTMY